MMHFAPCFRFHTLFPKEFLTPWKISQILPFPKIFFRFSSTKISDDLFLVINQTFILSPLLCQIPLCFRQICVFSTYFICFSFTPYFYHEAFMPHTITYWTPLHNHIQVLLNFTG